MEHCGAYSLILHINLNYILIVNNFAVINNNISWVRQHKQAYMYKKIFSDFRSPDWQKTTISYYQALKAARVLLKCDHLLRMIGYTETEFKIIYPLLLHLEAYVYSGDLKYEEHQSQGTLYTENTWKKNIETLLKIYEIYDWEIQSELDNLEKYFLQESRLLLGEIEINEQVILDIFYIRSSDIYMLLRVVHKLKDIPYNEDLFKLLKPLLVIEEIRDDLESYEKDVAGNSFNTLRLYVQLYGKLQAAQKLREMRCRIIHNAIDNLAKADKRSIVQFWIAVLKIDLGIPFIFHSILNLVPGSLLVYCAKLLLINDDKYYGAIPQAIDEPRIPE